MLYNLQIIESLLRFQPQSPIPTPQIISTQNGSNNNNNNVSSEFELLSERLGVSADSFPWILGFIEMGGVEKIVEIINQITNDCDYINEFSHEITRIFLINQSSGVISRKETPLYILVLCLRIFHKILLLDPVSCLQSDNNPSPTVFKAYSSPPPPPTTTTTTTNNTNNTKVSPGGYKFFNRKSSENFSNLSSFPVNLPELPSGLIYSFVNISTFLNDIIGFTYKVLKASSASLNKSIESIQYLVQTVILITFELFSISSRSGEGTVELDSDYSDLLGKVCEIFKFSCYETNSVELRTIACREIFNGILSKVLIGEPVIYSKRLKYWLKFFTSLVLTNQRDNGHDNNNNDIEYSNSHDLQVCGLLSCLIYYQNKYLPNEEKTEEFVPNFTGFVNKLFKLQTAISSSSIGNNFNDDLHRHVAVETTGSLLADPSTDHNRRSSSSNLSIETTAIKGYLSVITSILTSVLNNDKHFEIPSINELIMFLYKICLFPSKSPKLSHSIQLGYSAPVCKSEASRRLAYRLLLFIVHASDRYLHTLLTAIEEESSPFDPIKSISRQDLINSIELKSEGIWNYDPSLLKKKNRYVGLINQGATCYMNSFLQVLFRTVEFSNAFIDMMDETPTDDYSDVATTTTAAATATDTQSSSSEYKKDILFQLKLLLCSLMFSEKAVYDTLSFCMSLRDYAGGRIDMGEQKDVYEVLCMYVCMYIYMYVCMYKYVYNRGLLHILFIFLYS